MYDLRYLLNLNNLSVKKCLLILHFKKLDTYTKQNRSSLIKNIKENHTLLEFFY